MSRSDYDEITVSSSAVPIGKPYVAPRAVGTAEGCTLTVIYEAGLVGDVTCGTHGRTLRLVTDDLGPIYICDGEHGRPGLGERPRLTNGR